MKLYFQRFIHHISGLPDFSALKFTKYNQYESLILPMQKYLEAAGVEFRFGVEVTNVIFEFKDGKKIASAIECKAVSYTHLYPSYSEVLFSWSKESNVLTVTMEKEFMARLFCIEIK